MGSRLNLHRWFSPTCLILAMLFSALRAEPETTISELRSEIESLRMRILSLEDKGFSGIRGNSSELESLGKMLGSTSFGIEIPKGFQVELGKAAVVAESRVRFGKRTFRNSKNFRSWRLVFVGIARHAKENNQSKIIVLHEDSREIVWEMQISNDRRIEFIDVGSVVSANGITEMDIIVVDDTGLMERFQIQWKKVVIAETSTTRQGSKSKRFRLKTQATVLSHESTHERNQISQIDYGDKSLEMLRRTGVTRHENVCLENSLAFAGYIKSWSQRSGVPTRLDINSSVLTSKRYRSIEYMLKLSFSGEIIIEKIVKYAGLPRLDDNKTEVYRAFIASSQNPLRTAPLTFEHSARKVMVILTSSDLHILSLDLKLRADPRILHFSCSLPQFRNSFSNIVSLTMQSRSGLSVLYAITSDGVLMTFDLSSLSEEDVDLASETCRLRSMISLNVPSSRNWSRCSILPLDSYLILMNPRHTTVSILSTSNHEQKLSPILVGEFDFFDLFNYYSTDNSSDMHHFDVLPYSVEMAQSAEKSVRDSLVIAYPINGRILSFQTKSSLPYPLEFSLAERIFM